MHRIFTRVLPRSTNPGASAMLEDLTDGRSSDGRDVGIGLHSRTAALRAYESGQHTRACELLRQEIAIAPTEASLYRGLGNALLGLGKLTAAAEAFERATYFDPNDNASSLSHRISVACSAPETMPGDPFSSTALMGRPVATDMTLVIPVFNTNIAYLNECLQSVIAQTVRPARILVIDDASTEPLTKLFVELLRGHPALELMINRRNLGLGSTMNLALRECSSKYVLKLDSDDIARPGLVQQLAADVQKAGEADVVGCQMRIFGVTEGVTCHPLRVTKQDVISGEGHWFVNNTGVLLNRRSVLSAGGYGRIRRLPDDYPLWVRMMLAGRNRFRNLPEVLINYRNLTTGIHANYRRGVARLVLGYHKLLAKAAPAF
jgi:glycosyl transferase family 2